MFPVESSAGLHRLCATRLCVTRLCAVLWWVERERECWGICRILQGYSGKLGVYCVAEYVGQGCIWMVAIWRTLWVYVEPLGRTVGEAM